MTKDDLYIGMMFKGQADDSLVGVCTGLKDNTFYFEWRGYNGCGDISSHQMHIQRAIQCFEYYGWKELSSLEKELI